LVTGEGPTSAAAWGRSQGPVQDRSDLGQDLGQVDLADARQRLEDRGLGMLARAAARARSRSVRLPSRLPSSRTWMRMQSTLDLGIELVDGDRAAGSR
jgi:hypothetical protein